MINCLEENPVIGESDNKCLNFSLDFFKNKFECEPRKSGNSKEKKNIHNRKSQTFETFQRIEYLLLKKTLQKNEK